MRGWSWINVLLMTAVFFTGRAAIGKNNPTADDIFGYATFLWMCWLIVGGCLYLTIRERARRASSGAPESRKPH